MTLDDTNIILDPGPGCLVRCTSSKPRLDPAKLDGIIISHKHLDHSNDANIMIEAMTEGGFKRRGVVFAPREALEEDPVILKYLRGFPERLEILTEGGCYQVGRVTFTTPHRNLHPVEAYGIRFQYSRGTVSFITDTLFYPELPGYYRADVVVMNVVRLKPDNPQIYHLSADCARRIVGEMKPRAAVMTHFGMTVLNAKPWELALRMEEELGVKVIAARDGMDLSLDEIL